MGRRPTYRRPISSCSSCSGLFLEQAGMIKLFTDFCPGFVWSPARWSAKVAVFSSALMGTITGSGVANVVTTGQFTIPLMKRFGYRAAFAGGVEATASMGSQLMPPVMGAVAFIMAETINVPSSKSRGRHWCRPCCISVRCSGWSTWRPNARAWWVCQGPVPESVERRAGALVSADSTAGVDRSAVFRPHAAVFRHRRSGVDRHRHPRFGGSSSTFRRWVGVSPIGWRSACCVLVSFRSASA